MREFRLIKEAINKFELNLKGLTILTEAASWNYVWTPIIAALAGAKVHAYSRDSKYASFTEVKEKTENLSHKLNIDNKIIIHNSLHKEVIASADIITNSGFLRPLNIKKLQYCKKRVVIPLMYETWEFRESDIDLNYCKKKGIPVLGTNESDSRLRTIEYLGVVVKKALFVNNIEVFLSKVAILGKGKFAQVIYKSLKNEECNVEIWKSSEQVKNLDLLDALVVADHQSNKLYLGNNGMLCADSIKKINPEIIIIHITGNIDIESINKNSIKYFPKNIAPFKWMSLTTDFAGPKPLIDLHTAGFKTGEIMYHNYISTNNYFDTINSSISNVLIQNF